MSYRDEGAFHEKVTNAILGELVRATRPRKLQVEGDWFIRGGIGTRVSVSYEAKKSRK